MPEWKQEIRKRLAGLKLEPTREAEIVEELAQHLEDRHTELRAAGLSEEEGHRAGLVELDESELLAKGLARVERPIMHSPIVLGSNRRSNMIGDLWLDLRYGIRILSRNPSFTTVAILTLALGIGANSAIFSVVNAVLLRPLRAEKPEELVRVYTGSSHASFPDYRDLEEENRVFSSLAAHTISTFNIDNSGRDEVKARVFGEMVTGNYFPTLEVRAAFGRTFETEVDGAPGAHPVAVVSHNLWKRRFGADPDLVGRTIALNGHQLTVIGIMPDGFRGTFAFGITPEVWVPVTMQPQLLPGAERFGDRAYQWLEVFGRVRPDLSHQQARAAISMITKRLAEVYPDQNRGLERTELYPLSGISAFRGLSFAPAIFVFLGLLMAIVGLVLLIACANVANLLLARAVMRQKEVAIRLALGAGRQRLIRQFLTESVLLALAGGAAGFLLAIWIMRALRSFQPPLPVWCLMGYQDRHTRSESGWRWERKKQTC